MAPYRAFVIVNVDSLRQNWSRQLPAPFPTDEDLLIDLERAC